MARKMQHPGFEGHRLPTQAKQLQPLVDSIAISLLADGSGATNPHSSNSMKTTSLFLSLFLSTCSLSTAAVVVYSSGAISGGTIDSPGASWTSLQTADNSYASVIQDPSYHESYGFYNISYNFSAVTSAIFSITIDSFSYDGATNAVPAPEFEAIYGVKLTFNGPQNVLNYSYASGLPAVADLTSFTLRQSDLGQNFRTIDLDFSTALASAQSSLNFANSAQFFIYLQSVQNNNFITSRNPILTFNVDASNAGNGVPISNAPTPYLTIARVSDESLTTTLVSATLAGLLTLHRRRGRCKGLGRALPEPSPR
jgi:hypothetical protein